MTDHSNKQSPAVSIKSLQKKLKEIVAQELEQLPDILEALPPAERVKAILQLLPFTAPKIEQGANDPAEVCSEW